MRRLIIGGLAGLALAASGVALAHTPGGLEVQQAWSRPTPVGVPAAGYMTIHNHGDRPQILVRVESPAARQVQVHRSVVAGGVARMEPVAQLTIPAKGSVRLEPGAAHLMLVGLRSPSRLGQQLPATLVFASGVKVRADLTVATSPPPIRPRSTHNH